MSLLKFLFNRSGSAPKEKYFVYKTKAEKYRTFATEVQQLLNEGKKVAVICVDHSSKEEVEKVLNAINISWAEDSSNVLNKNEVLLNSFQYTLHHSLSPDIEVRVADFHPHRSKNMELVSSFKDHQAVIFYTSLDNPVFKLFGSDRILHLMESLGMKENERIEHALVTKSIINAQQKLEEKDRG